MNDKKKNEIKGYFDSIEIPDAVSPENMKKMLDEKAVTKKHEKKRRNISVWGRIGASAAACAVIIGTGAASVNFMRSRDEKQALKTAETDSGISADGGSVSSAVSSSETDETKIVYDAPYMKGARSYKQVYKLMERAYKDMEARSDEQIRFDEMETADAEFSSESQADSAPALQPEGAMQTNSENGNDYASDGIEAKGDGSEDTEYSETHNQEDGVLEADIVKTDGKRIYALDQNSSRLNIAAVDSGNFTSSCTINIADSVSHPDSEESGADSVIVSDMYLYNGMIAVIGSVGNYGSYSCYDCYYGGADTTFAVFYSLEDEPQLLNVYYQDGYYSDVRISPEGYMFLISTYDSYNYNAIDDWKETDAYIPECGMDTCELIPPEDILLPHDPLDNGEILSYTVISSIDLTVEGQAAAAETKALAGYTGTVYCSAENMYTTVGWENTDITRISIAGGAISPAASATVEGYVNDQFSLSEYNGYLRVATTYSGYEDSNGIISRIFSEDGEWIEDNRVYVLDMDLNQVGAVTGFGKNETIKSVSFQGDMGYVVTYEQTDPLFAIDLSNPADPFITDDFFITGYSTYMEQWDDEHLLGFGVNADEYAVENGYKLVMFNNSDAYDLQEEGIYYISNGRSYDDTDISVSVYSEARHERKALLIAPEKNLIGVPITRTTYNYGDDYQTDTVTKYMFFSYEDGEFTLRGELSVELGDSYDSLNRAVYIGDYVYAANSSTFVSADIDTITEIDRVDF